ncbi:cytochrome b/b6 domain-containing protein [Aquincola sp. MAHUQ-54]|uniref:Cytochrome b/b6 domain-containing protein n=1 Tax=Aquincola agrisoli TaxID=3119538 RepID=A0AAW9QDL6_9BURK
MNGGPLQRIRVWDVPTRAFHWALAVAVVALVVTAKVGGNAMAWHFRLGYLVLALLAFRVLWGLVGGRWSRFSSFLYGPGSVRAYLRGEAGPQGRFDVGHSPLGALSVFALLAVLAAQVGTGLVADDEIANQGPLYRFVSGDTAAAATGWHAGYGQWIVISLVVLHVLAIAFYRLARRRDLLGPMLSGDKRLPAGTPPSADHAGTWGLAAVLLAACIGAAVWVASLGG